MKKINILFCICFISMFLFTSCTNSHITDTSNTTKETDTYIVQSENEENVNQEKQYTYTLLADYSSCEDFIMWKDIQLGVQDANGEYGKEISNVKCTPVGKLGVYTFTLEEYINSLWVRPPVFYRKSELEPVSVTLTKDRIESIKQKPISVQAKLSSKSKNKEDWFTISSIDVTKSENVGKFTISITADFQNNSRMMDIVVLNYEAETIDSVSTDSTYNERPEIEAMKIVFEVSGDSEEEVYQKLDKSVLNITKSVEEVSVENVKFNCLEPFSNHYFGVSYIWGTTYLNRPLEEGE